MGVSRLGGGPASTRRALHLGLGQGDCAVPICGQLARRMLAVAHMGDLLNYEDAERDPVCSVCGRSIPRTEVGARLDDCLVHARCLAEGLAMDAPCEPAP